MYTKKREKISTRNDRNFVEMLGEERLIAVYVEMASQPGDPAVKVFPKT